jgi:hypothetical protein
MTFKFPRSALPPQTSLSQRIERHTAAQAEFASLREIYRKAREAESARGDEIMQGWKAEAEAQRAEQAARDSGKNSDNLDD